jgi:hypothetical protein
MLLCTHQRTLDAHDSRAQERMHRRDVWHAAFAIRAHSSVPCVRDVSEEQSQARAE